VGEAFHADHILDQVCAALDGIACIVAQGKVVRLHAHVAHRFGFPSVDQAVGQPLHALFPELPATALDDTMAQGQCSVSRVRMAGGLADKLYRVDLRRLDAVHCLCVVVPHDRHALSLQHDPQSLKLLEESMDISLLCENGAVIFANRQAVQLLGYADKQAIQGLPLQDLVHPDYQDIVALGLDVLAEEEDAIPLKFYGANGQNLDVHLKVRALAQGGVFLVKAINVTSHKNSAENLREREERLQGIMDSVTEGLMTLSDDGRILSLNPAAEAIFALENTGTLQGRRVSSLLADKNALQRIVSIHETRGGALQEVEGKKCDGRLFPMEISVAEYRKGATRVYICVVRDITARKRAEEQQKHYADKLAHEVAERTRDLQVLSNQTALILNGAADGILGVDLDGTITFANPAAEILGWKMEQLRGLNICDALQSGGDYASRGPLSTAKPLISLDNLKSGQHLSRDGVAIARKNAGWFHGEFTCAPIDDNGAHIGAVVVFRDVTERKLAEERLQVSATVFEHTSEGIVVCDYAHNITMVNPAVLQMTHRAYQDFVGQDVGDVLFHDQALARSVFERVQAHDRHEVELWCGAENDPHRFAARFSVSVIRDEATGGVRKYAVIINDITKRKADEERIRYQASYDQLTNLPNRSLFMERLDQALARSDRDKHKTGLLFIDLDGFKGVNDTLGHEAGDILLQQAAARMRRMLRDTDTVARLGGDEFTIIISEVDGPQGCATLAGRIIDCLTEPFIIKDHHAHISASIGIGLYPQDAGGRDELIKVADAAMYYAKSQGKSNFQFFTAALNEQVAERTAIKARISDALENKAFKLMYRPVLDIKNQEISAFQCRMYWMDHEYGLLPPRKFAQALEEAGQIEKVGGWAVAQACKQFAKYMRKNPQHKGKIRLSIPQSVRELRRPNMAAFILDCAAQHDLAPEWLRLDISEPNLELLGGFADAELEKLVNQGVELGLSRFGSGKVPLSTVARMRFCVVTLDREMVYGIRRSKHAGEIIRASLSMARSMGWEVIAEGVDSQDILKTLKGIKCHMMCGNSIALPEDMKTLLQWVVTDKNGAPQWAKTLEHVNT
jgi:diguanylate cyclase (GGDEF)-like protein/PAS domain S-box-containing protein